MTEILRKWSLTPEVPFFFFFNSQQAEQRPVDLWGVSLLRAICLPPPWSSSLSPPLPASGPHVLHFCFTWALPESLLACYIGMAEKDNSRLRELELTLAVSLTLADCLCVRGSLPLLICCSTAEQTSPVSQAHLCSPLSEHDKALGG